MLVNSDFFDFSIPIDWQILSIDELKDSSKGAIAMGPFGSNIKAENFQDHGVPVIKGTNLNYWRFVDGEFSYLSPEKAEELKNSSCQAGDIIITHRGTIGQVGLIPDGKYKRYIVSQSGLKISLNRDLILPEYAVYYLLSRYGQHQIFAHEAQVGVPSISTPTQAVKSILISLPHLPEQQAIAEVLSSLDDKIDLLHRNNKTLEEMAEALFRQWFVKGAKEDWEEFSLDKLAEYLNGLALQKFPSEKGKPSIPDIKIREMNQGITDSTDMVSADIPKKYLVNNGDILFSWSGSLDVIIWSQGTGALNQHLFKVIPTEFPSWLVYFATRSFLPEFRDIANDKATTMGHIQRHHLSDAKIKLPESKQIQQYDKLVDPLFRKLLQNREQIHKLKSVRDTLLPKLMSGQVRVQA